jgi:hypothetical protein
VVVLNGSEEEVKQQREAMLQRRLEAKQAKAAKVMCLDLVNERAYQIDTVHHAT